MPEMTVDEPMKGATLEDLVAALGPKQAGGGAAIEITEDDAEPDPALAGVELADELPIDKDDDLTDVKGRASPRLTSIVESLLFAATEPLTVKKIRRILKDPSKEQIQLALKKLSTDTQARGVVLHQVAGGFRLRTNPDNAQFVQRMLTGRPVRLSRSQLEALAVIAYRQPVTKAEVDHVRGVDCGAVLKLLLERNLIKIVGRKEEPGRPHLYGTTISFLELFNLKSLRDMPDLHEFRELTEENEAVVRETHGSQAALAEEQEALGQEVIEFEDKTEDAAPQGDEPEPEPEPEPGPERGPVRLNKVLARAGVASRRGADELISAKRVKVNGKVVTELGTKVDPSKDKIAVDNKRIEFEAPAYILLNKPDGYVSTVEDERGRPTVVELCKDAGGGRLYPVGRLDFHTRGVLLLTNDGDLTARLLHPRYKVPKTYHAKFQGRLTLEELQSLEQGLELEDGTVTAPLQELFVIRETEANTWVQLTLTTGLNRQVRRMGEALGHPVLKLLRVAFADITAEGVDEGRWRRLREAEVADLKAKTGLAR